jgi:cyclopropane-fatty-acyl-phospholipid synthase
MRDRWSRLARLLSSRLSGTLRVDGETGSWVAGRGEPLIDVTVHDARAFRSVVRRQSIGLGESYVEGWWDAEDLTGVVRLLLRSTTRPRAALDRAAQLVSGPLARVRRRPTPDRVTDRRNVRAHYDLPPELFTAMLDDTMAYSCGIFETPQVPLEEAQRAKFERICQKLELCADDHLVEIGTGWGGLACYAASTYGCRVTTTTVSKEQEDAAIMRVKEANLSEQVTVLGSDFRDLDGTFDKLVSVEMIEAVDWRLHATFFSTCQRLLKPEGLMLLQAIVIEDASYERAKHHDDFVRRMIFPGGCLPSVASLRQSIEQHTELGLVGFEDIGHHYPPTLRHWFENINATWGSMPSTSEEERFRRLWSLYLCYCEAAFLEGHISDVQMLLGPKTSVPGIGG